MLQRGGEGWEVQRIQTQKKKNNICPNKTLQYTVSLGILVESSTFQSFPLAHSLTRQSSPPHPITTG